MTDSSATFKGNMGYVEFVAFIAACMALNALTIDIMLPALPILDEAFQLGDPNAAQKVIAYYLFGFAFAQLIYGPLSDRFGRKPTLLVGLSIYVIASALTTFAPDFELLLIGRVVQGLGAGAPRVIAISLTRDRYSGDLMGKVMSLALMIFMLVPIIAPSLGQLILTIAPWRWSFGALFLGGVGLTLWAIFRLKESLLEENRRPIHLYVIASGFLETLRHPKSGSYMIAMGVVYGSLVAFLSTVPQVFADVYDVGNLFGVLFACIAVMMSVASFLNSRLVMRFGIRRLSHLALAMFCVVNIVFLGLSWFALVPLWAFILLEGFAMFWFGFMGANFNSIAMEPMPHIAGTASSMIGFVSIFISTLMGYGIGQFYSGDVGTLALGNLILGGISVLVLVSAGQLFRNKKDESQQCK